MAIKTRFAALMTAVMLLLCGCGSQEIELPAPETSGSAEHTGSAEQPAQEEQIDPPIPEAVTEADGEDYPLRGMTICLDPGHGITSQTAQERVSPLSQETKPAYVSGASGANQTEEQVNLAVAQLARDGLEAKGATVLLTRETAEATVSNIERADIANHAGADLCIRIHADGSDDSSVSGISMLIPAGELLGTPEIEQPSAQAGAVILQAVVETTGGRDRGLVQRTDLTGFNWSQVPCILLEMGFLSNPQEDEQLASQEYRQKIADGITEGVCRWVEQG